MARRPCGAIAKLFGLAATLWAGACTPQLSDAELRGTPQVIAGDLIELDGRSLRLDGIDAPTPGQHCEFRQKLYDCGEIARAALLDLTAGTDVVCQVLDRAAGAILPARCSAQGYDLSEGMVYTGWALVRPGGQARYGSHQQTAERKKHGLWRGRFVEPWAWERGERLPEERGGG